MNKKKVLILDGAAAHANAIGECLKKTGYEVGVICNSKDTYGYHSNFIDEHYISPDVHAENYASWMIDFLKTHKFDALIPISDGAAEFMSFHKEELKSLTGVLMPDWDIFEKGYDKNKLMSICRDKGYPHPYTVDLSKITDLDDDALKQFPYPGLLKPNLTSGGRGMTLIHNIEELKTTYPKIRAKYGNCHLQQFIKSGGRQIKVEIMTDAEGIPQYSSVIWKQRYYPVNGGSSCFNTTIYDPITANICSRLLHDIGWIGFADFDLIENTDTGELLIMELNPRTPACIRSVYKSGLDFATMIADLSVGKNLREYKYTPGKSLRHLGFDILWFLKSPNRFKVKPSWFNFIGKNLYYQDWLWGDTYAFIRGTWGNFKKQMNPEFRKSKNGVNI